MEVYQVDSEAWADHLVDFWYDTIKDKEVVGFSTTIQFHKLRLEHKKGNIHITKIITKDQEELNIDENGQLSKWPVGFQDEFNNLLDGLLGWKE